MTPPEKPSSQRFPDLYALLKLEPLESDVTVIAAAMQRLQAQAQSSGSTTSNPSSAVRAAKILELGKLHLLHPKRKQRYDRLWQQFHFQPMPDKVSVGLATVPALAGLLPQGDPREPFRLDEYTRFAAQQPQPDYKADFEKLLALLSPTTGTSTPSDEAAANWNSTQSENNAVRETIRLQASPPQLRRKQRERKILWIAISGLAGLAAVLAIGYRWSQISTSPGTQAMAPTGGLPSPAVPFQRPSVVADSPPRRSGLPGVEGIGPDQDLISNIDDLVPVAPPPTSTPATSMEQGQVAVPAASELMGTQQQKKLSETALPETMLPDMPAPTDPSPDQPLLDDATRASWARAMQQAKQLIGQQQYSAARRQLAANETLAKTDLQKSQLQRLSQMCSLAEEFQQALREVISGLTAGEVITLSSSTTVGWVESTEESITIRMRGENRTFLLTELPIGLAFALSDLTLDMSAAGTLARKAAFAWTHAGAAGNDVALQRAREMLSAAAAAGAVEADLLQVFSDDYQLAAVAMESK